MILDWGCMALIGDKFFTLLVACFFGMVSSEDGRCDVVQKENKCPGFGDKPDLAVCCPSKVEIGDYYCCSIEEKRRSEAGWRNELANNFGEIVGGIVAALLICSTLICLCCFYCNCCYLHKFRRRSQFVRSENGLYQPNRSSFQPRNCENMVRGLHNDYFPPSEPLMRTQRQRAFQGLYPDVDASLFDPKSFEAPPPYPIAQQYPVFAPGMPPPTPSLTTEPKNADHQFAPRSVFSSDFYAMQNDLNCMFDHHHAVSRTVVNG